MGRKAVSRYFYCVSIVMNLALAAITLVAGRYASVTPETSAIYPFLALSLPFLLLINLAGVLYWMIRLRCWWIIPAAAIAGNWGYISTVYRYSKEPAPKTEHALTIATYNVGAFQNEGMGYTCKDMAQYMREQKVDVVCMQEMGFHPLFPVDSVKAAFADWPYCEMPALGKPMLQLAVFSRYPIKAFEHILYPNSGNSSMWCDIDADGKMIRVFNNHLQTTEVNRNRKKISKELDQQEVSTDRTEAAVLRMIDGVHKNFIERARQADVLRQRIDSTDYSMLVCGDFNSIPSSYTYRTVKGTKLLDGFQTCGHGYMYTFHYIKRMLRIDYVFHTPDLKGLDYFSPNLDYSDHNPVIMRVGW